MAVLISAYGAVKSFGGLYDRLNKEIISAGATLAGAPITYPVWGNTIVAQTSYELRKGAQDGAIITSIYDGSPSISMRPCVVINLIGSEGLCSEGSDLVKRIKDVLYVDSLAVKVGKPDVSSANLAIEVISQRLGR